MTRLSDSDLQPVIDALDDIHQLTGWSRHRIFTTWIDLVLATLARDDDAYMDHIATIETDTKGDTRPVATAYARAFGDLYTIGSPATDVLGAVYEQYGLTSDAFGQFFTPPNIAVTMAHIQLGTVASDHHTRDDPLRIADPACGSGRLLLAVGRHLASEAPGTPVLFFGQDKDPLCGRMTAINFALAGLPGYVTHGDSITLKATTTWKIVPPRGFIQGPIQEIDPIPIGLSNPSTTLQSPAGEQSELSAFRGSGEE